jgi:murein DD-endopeptidase MepM/ murein hydrolase activator NlpD
MPVTKTAKRALRGSKRKEIVNKISLSRLEVAIRENTAAITGRSATVAGNPSAPGGEVIKPQGYRVNSGYGMRFHPILRQNRMHTGIDYAFPMGTPVKSGGAGTVLKAGWRGALGKAVEVGIGNGLSLIYGHLNEILVQQGQKVTLNQIVGKSGTTGRSTGPHLHYGVNRNGVPINPNGNYSYNAISASAPRAIPQVGTREVGAVPQALSTKPTVAEAFADMIADFVKPVHLMH